MFTLFLARPIAVFVALAGTSVGGAEKAFMAWFGPRGVATMTFSLIVLGAGLGAGQEIFNLAALTVFVSIVVARPDRHAGGELARGPRGGAGGG